MLLILHKEVGFEIPNICSIRIGMGIAHFISHQIRNS
jgi:hypothetical protein